MAMQPRIAGSSRLAAIPIPNRGGSVLADGLQVAAQAFGAIDQSNRQTNSQVDAMNHALDMKKQDEADQLIAMQQTAEMAMMESRIDRRIADERSNAKAGAVDHTDNSISIINEELTAFNEGFGQNERVRQRFGGSLTQMGARFQTRETLYESDQFAKAQGEAAETYISTVNNSLLLNPDLQATEDALTHWREVVVPNMKVNDDVKAKLLRDGGQQIMGSMLNGRLNAGKFGEVEALIQSGKLNGVFDDVEPWLKKVDNEKRAAAALAEAAESAARTEARNDIKAVEEKIKLGINPTPDEIAAVRKKALAAGLTDADIIGLDGMGIQQAVNRQYSEAADPTGAKAAAAAAVLNVKIGDGTANEAEQVSYQQLKRIADARSKATGSAMSDLAAKGPQGQMEVLGQLNALPPAQRYTAAKAAGGNKGEWLGRVSQLPQKTQQFVVDGRAARTDRPKDFGDAAVVRKSYQNILGSGLAADLGGGYAEVMDIAWDIYAGNTAARGESGFDEGKFRKAVRIAFGATVNKDGNLQGGVAVVNGRTTILPDTYTAPDMEKRLARADFSGAVYRDGSAAAKADILANYRMVWIGYTATGAKNYKFVDAAGNPLMFQDGAIATKGFR